MKNLVVILLLIITSFTNLVHAQNDVDMYKNEEVRNN